MAADTPMPEPPPALHGELVKQFVTVAHGNPDAAKEMLAAEPGLLNSCWDWGGGDFETALGAAGHMGHVELARYLLSVGARPELHAMAMLDEVDFVKAALAASPHSLHSPGPHGITLVQHAEIGDAARVLELLNSLGD